MCQALCLDLGLDCSAKDISIIDETHKFAAHESIINLQTLFEKTEGLKESLKKWKSQSNAQLKWLSSNEKIYKISLTTWSPTFQTLLEPT